MGAVINRENSIAGTAILAVSGSASPKEAATGIKSQASTTL